MVRKLSRRAVNRATLERQWLLARHQASALEAITQLTGLQSQAANPPYIGLWNRVAGFGQQELTDLLYGRRAVRTVLMRGTQHIVTAADYLWLRPLLQPVLSRARQAGFGRRTASVDLEELAAAGRSLLRDQALTRAELRSALAGPFPGEDGAALAWSLQYLLPVVNPPPCGTWNKGGAVRAILAESWLGEPLAAGPGPARLIRRYLAAFGPATVRDVQAWSGLTRLREVADELRPSLEMFTDEDGQELLDLPDAPRPAGEEEAPVRFLPEFDNLMVGHANRERVMTAAQRAQVCVGSAVAATVLVDGFVAGIWTVAQQEARVAVSIRPLAALSASARADIAAEAAGLAAFTAPGKELALAFE